MKNYLIYSLVTASILTGCAPSADPKISMEPPSYVEELPPKHNSQVVSNPGSLFGKGENPLFSDRKAMNVNDILTVVISENTIQSSKAQKSINEESKDKLGAGIVTAPGGGVLGSAANALNKFSNIGFESGSSNNFSGGGSNSRNDSFKTTISARIVKVLSNGNYFIEGSRELLINGEKQIIQISGVIRPYDILQNNQIDSKYIADAKIHYSTQGDFDRATKKPWGSKLLQSIWPF